MKKNWQVRMKRILIFLLTLFVFVPGLSAQNLTVDAPNLVEVGESFNLSFVYDGSENVSDFNWNEGGDFLVVWGPQQGSSTSISIINGKHTKSVKRSYTYVLQAQKAGVFYIPSATLSVKGKTLTSEPRRIEVVGQSAPSQASSASGSSSESTSEPSFQESVRAEDIILKMELNKRKVMKGEPIRARLKLYQRANISGFDDVKLPSFNGFWSQDVTPQQDIQFQRENYNGMIYNAAVIKDYVIIPQNSGKLVIEPAELVCLVYQRISHNTGSIFDGFFDDYKTLRKRVATQAVTVNVSPLPSPAPASFYGGVGDFEISVRLGKDSLKTHEAASLYLTVKGKGNLSLLETPKLKFPPDFELYDTKTEEQLDKSTGGTTGWKTYEYPFIPRSYGDFVIPAVEYSYYDAAAKKYVTRKTQALPIYVERTEEKESFAGQPQIILQGANKKGVKNLASDIRFIHPHRPKMSASNYFFMGSAAFVSVLVLLIVLFVSVLFFTLRVRRKNADIVAVKTRKATKMARRRLKAAGDYLDQNLSSAFYEALHKALLGYVCDKMSIPMSELTKESIQSSLIARGVAEEEVRQFMDILDACEMARYSPQTDPSAMREQYEKAVQSISMIDSQMANTKKSQKGLSLMLLLLCLSSQSLFATDYVDSLWNQATRQYTEGQYQEAVQSYLSIVELGLYSADLHYNLGNAYFKSQHYGFSILHYEKALKLAPSHKDARFNLQLANEHVVDDIEQVPEFILTTFVKKIGFLCNSDVWAVLFLVFLSLTLLSLLFLFLSRSLVLRKTGFACAIVAVLLAAASLSFSLVQKRNYTVQDSAIVVRSVVEVKSSPTDDDSSALFILHEGTKVKLLDTVGPWKNVELSDGRQGWMKDADLEII